MTRVFWDTMLFVYLLEGHPKFGPLVEQLLKRSYERGDILLTSWLALAEVLAGMPSQSDEAKVFLQTVEEMGFRGMPFERGAVEVFRMLRRDRGLGAPDAIQLACAASARTDLFLTGDKELLRKRLHVPGIAFIADLEQAPL
jgi:uncharacterized protein